MVVVGSLFGRSGLAAFFTVATLLFWEAPAAAFCRTRSCNDGSEPADSKKVACEPDEKGCPTAGAPLYWPTPAFKVLVDAAGSRKLGISGEQAQAALGESLSSWTSVECGGSGNPSIGVDSLELVSDMGAIQEALQQPITGQPANSASKTSVLTFVDDDWSYISKHAIALTTVSFGIQSGRIAGADIEVNSDQFDITAQDAGSRYDLLSILTHESGHVLGLADLLEPGPTMYGHYDGGGDIGPRSLEDDDVAGICTIYPPGRLNEEGGCGCRLAAPAKNGTLGTAFVAGLTLLAGARRRRSALTTGSRPKRL